jgi:hypothetical protein
MNRAPDYRHAAQGTSHCVVDGQLAASTAEPGEENYLIWRSAGAVPEVVLTLPGAVGEEVAEQVARELNRAYDEIPEPPDGTGGGGE